MERQRRVEPGDWRTLETFWNATGTAFFRRPAGAHIRVRYGVGWLGSSSQTQTLDGQNYKKLTAGKASITRARMQMRVDEPAVVSYEVYPGEVALQTPKRRYLRPR